MCDNCLCNLEKCQAECCKEFRLNLTENIRVFKGMTVNWICDEKDLKYYYKLHNCEVKGNIVSLKLNNFKKEGRSLTIYETCQGLTQDFRCAFHGSDKQPIICHFPNKTGIGNGPIYLTKNCVFKKNEVVK